MGEHLVNGGVGIELIARIVHSGTGRDFDRYHPIIQAEIAYSSRGFGLTAGSAHT